MRACTCTTLIFLHPVTYHLWDKSCAEQMHRSWPMVGKTSVLRQRRRDAFSLTLIERKQSPFICTGSQKSTALAHKRPHVCPSSPTHAHTHTCMHKHAMYLSVVVHSEFLQVGIHLMKGWGGRAVLSIVRFLQNSRLCRLPLEMYWIGAFFHQLAFFLCVTVIRATDKNLWKWINFPVKLIQLY